MGYKYFLWIAMFTASLAACNNIDETTEPDIDPNSIYFDYKITGDEESSEVTCLVQYRYGGPEGESLKLDSPSGVLLDNKPLLLDSAQQTGAFYEARIPMNEFIGNHTLTFTNLEGKKYNEAFQFSPFSIAQEMGDTVERGNISLPLEGTKDGNKIRVVLIDTSFKTDDLNEVILVKGGSLTITKAQLKKVTNGPVTLQLYEEKDQRIKNGTGKGGNLSITYSITKEFELVGD